ncbi:MAG: hypothetical protein R3F43_26925 [bacterium]
MDAAVVGLNGQEIARFNLPEGPLAPDTAALESGAREVGAVVGRGAPGGPQRARGGDPPCGRRRGRSGVRTRASTPSPSPAHGARHGAVVINEILYHPRPRRAPKRPRDRAVQPSESQVDLSDWGIVDGRGSPSRPGTSLPGGTGRGPRWGRSATHPGVPRSSATWRWPRQRRGAASRCMACGELVDEVRWADGGRWPEAAGRRAASPSCATPEPTTPYPRRGPRASRPAGGSR